MPLFAPADLPAGPPEDGRDLARAAERAAEAFNRSRMFLEGWLPYLDKATGLLPQRLGDNPPLWTPHNSAADNFPFMLISAAFTSRDLFGPLLERSLVGEISNTIQLHGLPGTYDLGGKRQVDVGLDRLIFGASEYAKDGLVPMVEILGPGIWSRRMASLAEGVFAAAGHETAWGMLPSNDAEVNGEMLQVLCRLFWMTGRNEYLAWARRIGDAYCFEVLPGNHGVPAHVWDFAGHTGDGRLKLRDHGCEIISGLSLLYAIEKELGSERAEKYFPPVDRMLKRAVEIGVDSMGLFVNEVDAATGEVTRGNISDCWGYDYYAWVTMAMVTGDRSYLQPVRKALDNIHHCKDYRWEPRGDGSQSHDGIADAVEGALLLLSHLPVESAFDWVEHEAGRMFAMQRDDGTIEGWWGDGNFARTALMYALYKTRGCRLDPWREDLRIAARSGKEGLIVHLDSGRPWSGKLLFDPPRHSYWLGMRRDYPRINAFAEWSTFNPLELYHVAGQGLEDMTVTGQKLIDGIEIQLSGEGPLRLNVFPDGI
ncbi:MAG: hypothetical protein FVQ81_17100 [Candidatus Glassbacteria bacterium]|nr:hypothetical protein [Candidatus Glassbacteria bacterium]